MVAAALTGHRRLHGRRREKCVAPRGRPSGDASPETPVAHLRRLHHHARATERERGAEYCRPCVPHAPTV